MVVCYFIINYSKLSYNYTYRTKSEVPNKQCAAVITCLSVTRDPAHSHDTDLYFGDVYPREAIHRNIPATSYINFLRCLGLKEKWPKHGVTFLRLKNWNLMFRWNVLSQVLVTVGLVPYADCLMLLIAI